MESLTRSVGALVIAASVAGSIARKGMGAAVRNEFNWNERLHLPRLPALV